jgi:hypothetical protein
MQVIATKGSHIKGAAEDEGSLNKWVICHDVISIFMSQKWPFRGSERTFSPLRGLKEGGLFIAKGAAREKQGRLFFEFSPYHLGWV